MVALHTIHSMYTVHCTQKPRLWFTVFNNSLLIQCSHSYICERLYTGGYTYETHVSKQYVVWWHCQLKPFNVRDGNIIIIIDENSGWWTATDSFENNLQFLVWFGYGYEQWTIHIKYSDSHTHFWLMALVRKYSILYLQNSIDAFRSLTMYIFLLSLFSYVVKSKIRNNLTNFSTNSSNNSIHESMTW